MFYTLNNVDEVFPCVEICSPVGVRKRPRWLVRNVHVFLLKKNNSFQILFVDDFSSPGPKTFRHPTGRRREREKKIYNTWLYFKLINTNGKWNSIWKLFSKTSHYTVYDIFLERENYEIYILVVKMQVKSFF